MLCEVQNSGKADVDNAPLGSWISAQGISTRNNPTEADEYSEAEAFETDRELASHDIHGTVRSALIKVTSLVSDCTISFGETQDNAMIRVNMSGSALFVHETAVSCRRGASNVLCAFPRGIRTGSSGTYVETLVLLRYKLV